ncbi:hypothetical protein GGR52DRAFT_542209 [Hypoxylon sp. FL1284]|nr:hypothetical protein GGR52DRAFT_542209 [Hypoxylon sp. FL1284]
MIDFSSPGSNLTQLPSGIPPSDVIPNFVDPVSRAWTGRAAVYTSLPAMVLLVGLRVYVRLVMSRSFSIDDYLCVLAAATSTAYDIVLVTQFFEDIWGRHRWDIPLATYVDSPVAEREFLISSVLYNLSALFIKLSFLSLYYRLFYPFPRLLVWSGVVMVLIYHIAVVVLVLVFCFPHPYDGDWTMPSNSEQCNTQYVKLNAANGIISTVTDIYVLAIPVSMVVRLVKLSSQKKLEVASIFLTGLSAVAFAITKAVYIFIDLYASPSDDSWYGTWVWPLTIAEVNVGIICSCMPVVFAFFKALFKRFALAWSSLKSSFWSSARDDVRSSTCASSDNIEIVPSASLPRIPNGGLTGLASFFQKGFWSNSRRDKTRGTVQGSAGMSDGGYANIERQFDYHNYL